MAWKGIGRRLRELFQARDFDGEFFQELEDAMIEADMGVRVATELSTALREQARKDGLRSRQEILAALKTRLKAGLLAREIPLRRDGLNVLLILGVNGVGKTTTIAKLASHLRANRGMERILLVAGDTFRAAAIEQLTSWGRGWDCPWWRRTRGGPGRGDLRWHLQRGGPGHAAGHSGHRGAPAQPRGAGQRARQDRSDCLQPRPRRAPTRRF